MLSLRSEHWLELLWLITLKEIKSRYKNTFFGFLWMFLNPLIQMTTIGAIFQYFIHVENNYFLFLFIGLLAWNFFSYTVTKTTPAYIFERMLIRKAKFPREIVVLSIVLSNFFHLLISIGLLLLVLPFFVKLTLALIWLPLILIWLLVLTTSVSLLFSSLNVRFRDINFFVQVIMPIWFYVTPIVYSLDLIPQKIHFFFYLNPLTFVIMSLRLVFLNVPIYDKQILWSIGSALVVLFIGVCIYIRESKNFDDWL